MNDNLNRRELLQVVEQYGARFSATIRLHRRDRAMNRSCDILAAGNRDLVEEHAMNRFVMDRRHFIYMIASFMAALRLAPTTSFAQEAPIRREVHSDAAKGAIEDYRRAVGLMQDESRYPVRDPRSWWFQANIHWMPGGDDPHGCFADSCLDKIFSTDGVTDPDVTKQIEALERLARGDMERIRGGLALDSVWAKCPHGQLDFLPWHRLYTWYFERIVQSVLGKNDFALPYWNYLDNDKRNLPPAFRDPTLPDGSTNYLYFRDRSDLALAQSSDPNDPLLRDQDLQWLLARNQRYFQRGDIFESSDGTFEFGVGFSSQLESFPHNPVHGRIGKPSGIGIPPTGMANPAYAARDPIFYLHHAQLDRLWEFWRRENPSIRDLTDVWSDEPYVFVLADGRAEGYPADVYSQMVGQVYDYDTLAPISGEPITEMAGSLTASAAEPVPRRVATGAAREIVGTVPAEIKLAPIGQASFAEAPTDRADRSFFLSLDVKEGTKSGGLNFDIFLDTPQKAATSPAAGFSVFMDPATPMHVPGPGAPGKLEAPSVPHLMERTILMDVTQSVRKSLEQGANLNELTVRVVPSGPVPKGALSIERTTLIER